MLGLDVIGQGSVAQKQFSLTLVGLGINVLTYSAYSATWRGEGLRPHTTIKLSIVKIIIYYIPENTNLSFVSTSCFRF